MATAEEARRELARRELARREAAKPRLGASGTFLRGGLKGAASLLELPVQAYAGFSGLVNSGLAAGARALGADGVADTFERGAALNTRAAGAAPLQGAIDAGFNAVTRPGSGVVEMAGNVALPTAATVGIGRRLVQGGAPAAVAIGRELSAAPKTQLASNAAATGAGQAALAAGAGPLGAIAASLAAGTTVGGVSVGAGGLQERGFAAPVREGAARVMQEAALDPQSAAAAIRQAPAPVSGAPLSTVEASLDPGLAGFARALQTAPEIGAQLGQARQTASLARSGALDSMGGVGTVTALEDAGRARAALLEAQRQAAVGRIGPVVEPEAAGSAFRSILQGRFQAERGRASAMYNDIPFGDEPIALRPPSAPVVDRAPDMDRAAFQQEGVAAASGNVRGMARATGLPADMRETDPVAKGVVAWIRAKGGIKAARGAGKADFVGDLQARGITSRNAPGLYNNRGFTFDELLTSAKDEGLLGPEATADDLADMIDAAYFGKAKQSWAGLEEGGETARERMDEWGRLFQSEDFDPARASDEDWDGLYRRVTGAGEVGAPDVPTPGKLAGEFQNSLSAIAGKYYLGDMSSAPPQLERLFARLMQADEATPQEMRRLSRDAYDLGAMMGSDRIAASASKALAKSVQAYMRQVAAPAYVSKLRAADANYRRFARTYRSGEAGRVLGSDRFGVPKLDEARVPAAIVQRGDPGAVAIERARVAAGPDATEALVRARLRQEAEARGAGRVADDYAQALRAVPPVAADVTAARQAEALAEAFASTPLGRMYADPERAVSALMSRNDAGRGLRQLVEQVKGDKEAMAGLRRAVVDHVMQKSMGREVVQSGGQLEQVAQVGKKMDALRDLLKKTQGTPLFTMKERNRLNRLFDEVKRAQFAVTANRTAGSDSARNFTVITRFFREGGISGQDIASKVPGRTSRATADVAAWAINAARRGGQVQRLVADAMLDPKLAAELLEQATPSRMERIDARLVGSAIGTTTAAQDAGYSPPNR